MIRGALILAAGFALGYSKGLSENTAVLNKIEEMGARFANYMDSQPDKTTEDHDKTTPDSDKETPQDG